MTTQDDVPMNPEYMDYAEHERTFSGFIFFTKWGVVIVVCILIFLALFVI